MEKLSDNQVPSNDKDNIVRFINNLSLLLFFELKIFRVSSPSSKV